MTNPTRRRRWPWVGAVIIIVAAAGVAAALMLNGDDQPSAQPAAPAVVGGVVRLTLPDFMWDEDAGCWGREGYDDIREGTQIVVTDPAGKVIGTGALQAGIPLVHPDGKASECSLHFAVQAPGGLKFYGVEVAHRGRVQYTPDKIGAIELGFD